MENKTKTILMEYENKKITIDVAMVKILKAFNKDSFSIYDLIFVKDICLEYEQHNIGLQYAHDSLYMRFENKWGLEE